MFGFQARGVGLLRGGGQIFGTAALNPLGHTSLQESELPNGRSAE